MEFCAGYCEKCQKITKHNYNIDICHECGYKKYKDTKEEQNELDFIKTQEQDVDLLK